MRVSVCMATYNGEKYVHEQLISILAQITKNDEIIISDDNSTDQTINIIKNIKDNRIKIYYNKGKKGYTSNFENALNKASGDFIFLSDQDDVWLPGKYNTVVAQLFLNDLVVTNSKVTDEHFNLINESFFSIYNSGTGICKNIIRNTYYGSCMAFTKVILERAIPFPKNREIGFDLWIGMVAEITGKVKFVEEPFLYWRRHNDTTTSIGESKRPIYLKLYKRYVTFIAVIRFYLNYKFNRFTYENN